jgi:hypothetical protein
MPKVDSMSITMERFDMAWIHLTKHPVREQWADRTSLCGTVADAGREGV